MIKTIDLRIPYQKIADQDYLKTETCKALNVKLEEITALKLIKKSLDARKSKIVYQLRYEVFLGEDLPEAPIYFQAKPIQPGPMKYI